MAISVTKRAYARGIGEILQRSGAVQFPTAQALKTASDHAAAYMATEPSVSSVPHEECVKVASAITAVNDRLRSTGKVASHAHSVSISGDLHSAVGDSGAASVEHLLYKLSEESTLVGMGDHENTLESAAEDSELAAMDLEDRPEGYAVGDVGENNIFEDGDAQIGMEMDHPGSEGDDAGEENSITEASKSAYYRGAAAVEAVMGRPKAAAYYQGAGEVESLMGRSKVAAYHSGATDVDVVVGQTKTASAYRSGARAVANFLRSPSF